MKLLYLCTVDPAPPNSDYPRVLEFFDELPEYLHPNTPKIHTENIMLFVDRYKGPIMPNLYDVVIVFFSERFLSNQNAMEVLKKVHEIIPNLVGIDLFDNITPEQKMVTRSYTRTLLSSEEGKEFLAKNFPDPDAERKQEAEELNKSIETDGYTYLDETIKKLNDKVKINKRIAYLSYVGSFTLLAGLLGFFVVQYLTPKDAMNLSVLGLVQYFGEILVISGLTVALSRFLFLLGKSFMVEAIRCSDRAHAISLGRLYLKFYKNKFEWSELKEVLQSWNIDQGSAFRNLDAKDIEVGGLDQVFSALKK